MGGRGCSYQSRAIPPPSPLKQQTHPHTGIEPLPQGAERGPLPRLLRSRSAYTSQQRRFPVTGSTRSLHVSVLVTPTSGMARDDRANWVLGREKLGNQSWVSGVNFSPVLPRGHASYCFGSSP